MVSYTYGDSAHPGDITSVTDANQKVWAFGFNTYGDLASTTDPLGDKTTYIYDNVGRLGGTLYPLSNCSGCQSNWKSSYAFYPDGDRKNAVDALNNLTQYVYDPSRNLTQVTDPRGFVTNLVYDKDNQLTQVTRGAGTPASSTVITTFDADGNVKTEQDGLSKTTSFTYDALNFRRTSTDPLLNVTGYGYDPMGNLTSVESANGPTTSLGYDAAGRLATIYYSSGATPSVSYTYDADNQRLTMRDGTGTSSYVVDSLHRLTQVTNGAGQTTAYGYDLKGQLTSITYPGGSNKVTRTYDDAGRLSTVTDWLRHTTTYSYDLDSNMTKELYPSGLFAAFVPDLADHLGTVNDYDSRNNLLFGWSYGRDQDLNLCNVGGASCMPGTMGPYDSLDRQGVAPSTSYTYDAAGNLGQMTKSTFSTTLSFNNAEQITSFNELNGSTVIKHLTYQFDANGNRTQQTDQNNATTTFSYDQANRLTRFSSGATSATYSYDGDGQRSSKTVGTGARESFVWNAADSTSIPLVDGTTSYVTGLGGLPIEQITSSGTVSYYHQDQLGSTGRITDSRGRVVNSYTYDSYGNVTASTVGVTNPIEFAGQYVDSESSLQYLRTRYYEPAPIGSQDGNTVTGLFLTKDPMSLGTESPYAYAADSPQNATDSTGQGPNWQAGWNALAGGVKDIGRQAAIVGLLMAIDWIGQEQDDLQSGDPLRVARGVVGAVGVAAMVVPGPGEAVAIPEAIDLAAEARTGISIAARAGGVKAPMTLLRNVDKGERLTDLFQVLKEGQYTTGNEYAIVKLASGDRAIVYGGPEGIDFAEGQITMIYAHTHPYTTLAAGPSADDFQALRALGQSSSWLLERGLLTRFWATGG